MGAYLSSVPSGAAAGYLATVDSDSDTDITMKVIASVEKYENAGMKFSTVPAFALAESRAFDACCLFLTVHTLPRSQLVFLPRKVPSKLRIPDQIWNCTRGERKASTHELRPVLFPCASC
eukprot:scaffold28569_cov72-Phaeocystis_antarctica.AAC.1